MKKIPHVFSAFLCMILIFSASLCTAGAIDASDEVEGFTPQSTSMETYIAILNLKNLLNFPKIFSKHMIVCCFLKTPLLTMCPWQRLKH